jgi:rod shape-determining protein MreC
VNLGQEDGVRLGNLVVNSHGVVGKISEVYTDRSRVQLITSPRFRLGAVSAINRDEGVIKGVDWRTLVLDYIHAGSKISLGEKVYTLGEETIPGGNDNRPKGEFIGTVVSRKVDNNGFLEIFVQPAISPCQLGTLVVMIR